MTAEATAAGRPSRTACWMLVNSVGRIMAARATGAGMIDPKAEIMIIGMAKPKAPFTKPAKAVTPKAATNCQGSSPNMGAR